MIKPLISIIIVFHNMRREAQRTLLSLSTAYQTDVDPDTYEVIAIDNGSRQPLDPAIVEAMGPQFRYHFHETRSVSPVDALNLGAQMSRGQHVAIVADGARMASPGLLHKTIAAVQFSENPIVCSLAWQLGADVQNVSVVEGYDQAAEDTLLDDIAWPADGYRLFEVSTLAQSSGRGFLSGFPSECSWVCMSRFMFDRLNGYDPAFQSPGGGLVNHDFVNRAAASPKSTFIVLLGEGVFHQIHGGVATNVAMDRHPINQFRKEYKLIRGTEYERSRIKDVVYFGEIPPSAKRFIAV